MKKRRKKK